MRAAVVSKAAIVSFPEPEGWGGTPDSTSQVEEASGSTQGLRVGPGYSLWMPAQAVWLGTAQTGL